MSDLLLGMAKPDTSGKSALYYIIYILFSTRSFFAYIEKELLLAIFDKCVFANIEELLLAFSGC